MALLFYPYAFSGICTGEMSGIRDRLDEFMTFDTEVLGISCDPVYSLRAFADADGLNFPLLSDFWPHGEVSRAYDVFNEAKGAPYRSSYVIDKDGRAAVGGAQRQRRRSRPRPAPRAAARQRSGRAGLDGWAEISTDLRETRDTLWAALVLFYGVEPLVTRDASGSTHFIGWSDTRR